MTRTLFRGGPVLTGRGPTADAVAIDGDRIVAVGAEARDWAASFDEVVDLHGRLLMPAFRDGHAHPLHAGINRLGLDLTGLERLDDILGAVRAWRLARPDEPWIVGRCYHPSALPDGLGRADWLDAACPDRPVTLYPTDHHAVWANTAAMVAAGIDTDTPEPPLGTIVRDGAGVPIGMFLEFGGIDLLRRFEPPLDRATQDRGLDEAMRQLTSEGIVFAQDASVRLDELAVYTDAARRGRAICRIDAAMRAAPESWTRQLPEFVAARDAARRDLAAGPWVTAETVKFFADGVIEAGTGLLLEPYEDAPHTCGLPNWSPAGLAEAVRAFDAAGFRIHIHAIGDGGVRMSLDAIEHAARENGARDRRPVIAHTQLVDPSDRARFAQLGVVANFEPLWACLDPSMVELTLPRLGPVRSSLQYPIGSLVASGAAVSFGSDWPVSSHRPLDGLAVAVTRQNANGEPVGGWLPDERVPIHAAIAAYTAGTAHQVFDDDAGTIAVGQRADLVVLDADITALAGGDVPSIHVEQTWLGGTRVFHA